MNRLSALTLLLAALCSTSLYEVEAQRQQQQVNRGLRALPLADAERKLANENANDNASGNGNNGNNGNNNGNSSDDEGTADPTTIAPSEGQTADGSEVEGKTVDGSEEDTTMSPTEAGSTDAPTDASSTVNPTEAGSTDSPTETGSTDAPTETGSTETPTQDGSTASPTEDASTANPTDESSTVSPTGEDSTITPTNEDSTAVPTSLAPTEAPVKAITPPPTDAPVMTEAPTEIEEPDDKSMEDTFSPTESPTADLTLSPTEAEEEPEVDGDCQDNPNSYDVMVDLQIDFQDQQVETCTPTEEQAIADAISDAMNVAFPTRVKTWDGTAEFGIFDFEHEQFYDDISEIAGARQLRGRMLEAAKRLAAKRGLSSVFTCPLRGDLDCPNGYCMWGCVEAATRLCGDDDSTEDWVDMGEDIKDTLIALAENGGYDCLGQLGHLDVLVTLVPGETQAPSTPPTSAPTEEIITRTFATPTASPTEVPLPAFADIGEVVPITTQLKVKYFKGQGGDLTGHTNVELQLMEELAQFIESIIWPKEEYKNFNGMNEGSLEHSWDENSRTLTLKFSTNIYFTSLDGETDHNLAKVITHDGNFHKFIQQLREHECEEHVDQHECNQWMSGIQMVSFQGTGTGRRLEMVEVVEEESA